MSIEIKSRGKVYTADDYELGLAVRLYHRPDTAEINPKLKLYGSYLEVVNSELGDSFFIPTDFIADQTGSRVSLSVPLRTVQRETWTRKPAFVAYGQAKRQSLPA